MEANGKAVLECEGLSRSQCDALGRIVLSLFPADTERLENERLVSMQMHSHRTRSNSFWGRKRLVSALDLVWEDMKAVRLFQIEACLGACSEPTSQGRRISSFFKEQLHFL